MPHFHGSFTQTGHRGDFGEGEVLEIPENQDFAIVGRELLEQSMHLLTRFTAYHLLTGCTLAGCEEIGEKASRLTERDIIQLLPEYAPFVGVEVVPMELNDPFQGEATKPGIKRKRRFAEIVPEVPAGIGQDVLDDVGRIKSRGNAAVESYGNQLLEPGPMLLEETRQGHRIAIAGLLKERLGLGVVGRHRESYLPRVLRLP